MILIKNCGLKQAEEVALAAATGASFVGLVYHPSSPRHLELPVMAALAASIAPPVKSVVVLVNPSDAILDAILKHFRPDYWQVHGVHDAERIAAIKKTTGIPVIAGVSVKTSEDIAHAYHLATAADNILFDTRHDSLAGGSGEAFDWSLLTGIYLPVPWFLAGGLTAENVVRAIRITGAKAVDVSSGIESQPGKKSLEKIAAFNKAVLETRT
jgi:phosphoribosylanthranilate isomerase